VGREDQIVVLAEAIVREERARELLVGRFGNPALHGAVTALADSAVARGVVIRTIMGRCTAARRPMAGVRSSRPRLMFTSRLKVGVEMAGVLMPRSPSAAAWWGGVKSLYPRKASTAVNESRKSWWAIFQKADVFQVPDAWSVQSRSDSRLRIVAN
jgi:hypothetical protein